MSLFLTFFGVLSKVVIQYKLNEVDSVSFFYGHVLLLRTLRVGGDSKSRACHASRVDQELAVFHIVPPKAPGLGIKSRLGQLG